MKQRIFVFAMLAALLLNGCGLKKEQPVDLMPPDATTSEQSGDRNPTAAELGRDETTTLTFTLEGMEETAPATLHIGQGYSLYIPDDGWNYSGTTTEGVAQNVWQSTVNDAVALTVSHYSGYSAEGAMDLFVADGDYVYEDLLGGRSADDYLYGTAADGSVCAFFCVESGGVAYVVSLTYPQEAAEGFGARLETIAATFMPMA